MQRGVLLAGALCVLPVVQSVTTIEAVAQAPQAAPASSGLRGEARAIEDAKAMVEQMGGVAIWREMRTVHFVHEWDIYTRPDIYLEHEILDLDEPRSWVSMDSEIFSRVRAYSPEHGHWSVVNGELQIGDEQTLERSLERAPFSIYRLARAVACDRSELDVRYGPMKDMPEVEALEFRGPDDVVRGWIALNARKEPIIWATTQYTYVLGPLRRFGNLRVPDWATTGEGRVRYEMVSLTGSREAPDLSLFAPPDAGETPRIQE